MVSGVFMVAALGSSRSSTSNVDSTSSSSFSIAGLGCWWCLLVAGYEFVAPPPALQSPWGAMFGVCFVLGVVGYDLVAPPPALQSPWDAMFGFCVCCWNMVAPPPALQPPMLGVWCTCFWICCSTSSSSISIVLLSTYVGHIQHMCNFLPQSLLGGNLAILKGHSYI